MNYWTVVSLFTNALLYHVPLLFSLTVNISIGTDKIGS